MESEVTEFIFFLTAEKGLAHNTRLAYEHDLEQFVVFLKVKKLDVQGVRLNHLREFIARLRSQGITPRSIARKVSALNQFFRFLLREGKVKANPAELLTVVVKSRRLPKHLTVEESFALIEAARSGTPDGIRDLAMMEVWYATGCRVSELASIGSESIDWKGGLVRLSGKGNRQRWVPLSQDALAAASRYKTVRHGWIQKMGLTEETAFFISERGRPFSRQTLWKWLQKLAVKAGIQRKVWPHMIRHSFATHVLQGGADLRTVQELLGHRSISTTEMYTHLNVENLKVMQRKYHPRD
jgi:integrase/recombinase XerD